MNMKLSLHSIKSALFWSLIISNATAWAGRPLTVDDANLNDVGAGHVEVWGAREAGKIDTFNIAPAFARIENWQLGAVVSRNRGEQTTLSAAQVKWRITPSDEKGCNAGVVRGFAHVNQGGGHSS